MHVCLRPEPVSRREGGWGRIYQLCVEFGQPWLALAVKDQEGVDHSLKGSRRYVCTTWINATIDWAASW